MNAIHKLTEANKLGYSLINLSGSSSDIAQEKRRVLLSCRPSDMRYALEFASFFSKDFSCYITDPSTLKTNDGAEYVRWLQGSELMQSEVVLVLLIGQESGSMKKIDWDTAAALSTNNSVAAGLMGVLLPDYIGSERQIPPRISDNAESGYASIFTWKRVIDNPEQFINLYDDSVMRSQDESARIRNDLPLRKLEY